MRRVLFEPERAQRMADDAASFSVLFNLDNQAPGRAIVWWIPSTRDLSPGVLEAAARCAGISHAYQQMSDEIATLAVNAGDKSRLRAALEAMAAMWLARSKAIGDPKPPADPTSLARSVSYQLARAYEAGHQVAEYFKGGPT